MKKKGSCTDCKNLTNLQAKVLKSSLSPQTDVCRYKSSFQNENQKISKQKVWTFQSGLSHKQIVYYKCLISSQDPWSYDAACILLSDLSIPPRPLQESKQQVSFISILLFSHVTVRTPWITN